MLCPLAAVLAEQALTVQQNHVPPNLAQGMHMVQGTHWPQGFAHCVSRHPENMHSFTFLFEALSPLAVPHIRPSAWGAHMRRADLKPLVQWACACRTQAPHPSRKNTHLGPPVLRRLLLTTINSQRLGSTTTARIITAGVRWLVGCQFMDHRD